MKVRGQGPITLLFLAILIGMGIAATRTGPRPEPAGTAGQAPSGAWVCPHGGGTGWQTTLYLSNPSDAPSTVRVTALGDGEPSAVSTSTVPAGTTAHVDVPSIGRDAATSVEWFGGWVAAGWVAIAGGGDTGVTAEPCGSTALNWFAPDGSTSQGSESTYLVIANPSAADAVFSVVLFAADRAPIRESRWTDLVLPGHRSMDLYVNHFAVSEAAVSAEVDVTSGRVAVASLGISKAGGVRSALGATALGERVMLPVSAGVGQSQLLVVTPLQGDALFGAILLSGQAAQPAGGLTQVTQAGQSAKAYPIISDGPSSVEVQTRGGARIGAALRSIGSKDTAATGGSLEPDSAWLVLPTVAGEPSHPGLVLVNPGPAEAQVTLHLLGAPGESLPADITVVVGPSSATSAPASFLSSDPEAAVLVRSTGAQILALGASTSLGSGADGYALAMGVPLRGAG